ncbi:MAG: hypothetical protein LBP59_16010 [Planctomycetaceae bacterium]|jgi:hypothetical protein|nr:hypothetical protein [Planctomycetaceae bacterium]
MLYVVSQFFKVLGFVLHTIPMGIWFAGLPLAILCLIWNGRNSSRFARRIFCQLPIMLAIGINFGIVPLLFTQTLFYKPFYTATILMAWHWFAVIPILIVGYYSVYLAAFSVAAKPSIQNAKKTNKRNKNSSASNTFTIIFGVIASACLIAIGIMIVNGQTLMVRQDLWATIMERTGFYGATTGLANNMSDPSVWIRLSTVFAISMITAAVWCIFDSHFLLQKINGANNANNTNNIDEANNIDVAYRRWTLLFAGVVTAIALFGLALIGCVAAVFKITGFVAAKISDLPVTELSFLIALIVLLAIVFILTLAMCLCVGLRGKILVALVVFSHVAALGCFGILRQLGQNMQLHKYVESAQYLSIQWEAFIPFLIIFVIGAIVVGWMLRQIVVSRNIESVINKS